MSFIFLVETLDTLSPEEASVIGIAITNLDCLVSLKKDELTFEIVMADQLSWSEARDEMRKYRENNTRFSERVLELWEDVICDSQHRLGDEIWVVLEQVCVAAIDCAQSGIFQGQQ